MNENKSKGIPVEIVFHPSWWHKHFGINFNRDYFFDAESRLQADLSHRKGLYEKFGSIGLGEKDAAEKPSIGSNYIAAGFLVSQLLGCKINFSDSAPPEVIARNMTDDEVMALDIPDVANTAPMDEIIKMMDSFEKDFGYVEGDFNWSGMLNVALDLRGQMFLMDYYTNPALVNKLLDIIYETILQVVNIIKPRTKTSSLSVNRVVGKVNPQINLHSNCSVVMISKETYDEFHLDYEKNLAENLSPYGIHHCGNDMHKVAESYAKSGACFYDVGWGSDIKLCREKIPDAIFSLRLDPVQMRKWSPDDVERELCRLVDAAGDKSKLAICCINMDDTVSDENILRLFEVASSF